MASPAKPSESTEAPLVTDTGEEPPPLTPTQMCCRHFVVFMIAALIGLLLGLGLKGTVWLILGLVLLVVVIGGIIYCQGYQKCYQDCVGCLDMNRDGRLTCRDCAVYFANSAPESAATIIVGLLLGFFIGLFAI